MKKFSIINETLESELISPTDSQYSIREFLVGLIKETTNSEEVNLAKELMRSYVEDANTTIIGLVNDSDVYDLYMTHRTDFDEILNEEGEYEKSVNELNLASMYDYIVEQTKRGVQLIFTQIVE